MPRPPREGPSPKEGPSTTPSHFPEVPPPQAYPSGDYSYILEIVMGMQTTMGKLTEAVESLKEQSKNQAKEIKDVSRDIHTAKTTVKVVGAILAAALAFLGWAVNKGVDAFMQMKQQPVATIQSNSPVPTAPMPQQSKPPAPH